MYVACYVRVTYVHMWKWAPILQVELCIVTMGMAWSPWNGPLPHACKGTRVSLKWTVLWIAMCQGGNCVQSSVTFKYNPIVKFNAPPVAVHTHLLLLHRQFIRHHHGLHMYQELCVYNDGLPYMDYMLTLHIACLHAHCLQPYLKVGIPRSSCVPLQQSCWRNSIHRPPPHPSVWPKTSTTNARGGCNVCVWWLCASVVICDGPN